MSRIALSNLFIALIKRNEKYSDSTTPVKSRAAMAIRTHHTALPLRKASFLFFAKKDYGSE